jgi:hypothetical protein
MCQPNDVLSIDFQAKCCSVQSLDIFIFKLLEGGETCTQGSGWSRLKRSLFCHTLKREKNDDINFS